MIKKLSIKGNNPRAAVEGDVIELMNHDVEVVRCEKSDRLMVHVDPKHVHYCDFHYLREVNVTIGMPGVTEENVCIQEAVEGSMDTMMKLYLFFSEEEGGIDLANCFTEPRLKN